MNHKLDKILQGVTSIQAALLRFRNEKGQQTFQAKVVWGDDRSIHCVISGDMPQRIRARNKNIHLIQKYHDDYFFISGYVEGVVRNNSRILSISVNKASWFVRKRRGSVSWFREKYTYENQQELKYAS
jgi:hypothetical protein